MDLGPVSFWVPINKNYKAALFYSFYYGFVEVECKKKQENSTKLGKIDLRRIWDESKVLYARVPSMEVLVKIRMESRWKSERPP